MVIVTSILKHPVGAIVTHDMDIIGVKHPNVTFQIMRIATKKEYHDYCVEHYPEHADQIEYFPYFYEISVD